MAADPNISPIGPASASSTEGFRPLVWFRVLMAVGIIANIAVAVLSIATPNGVIGILGLEPAAPLVWPRFAAFLLILLTMFYIPAAIDPFRHVYSAVGAILCRVGGFGFFGVLGGKYFIFGLYDLGFGLPQAILLFLAWRQRRVEMKGER